MTEITKISSKGQVVIPSEIRDEMGLEIGTTMVVTRMKDMVLLKKVDVPDLKAEFKRLTNMGAAFAKKTGIKTAEDVAEMVHKRRGIKVA